MAFCCLAGKNEELSTATMLQTTTEVLQVPHKTQGTAFLPEGSHAALQTSFTPWQRGSVRHLWPRGRAPSEGCPCISRRSRWSSRVTAIRLCPLLPVTASAAGEAGGEGEAEQDGAREKQEEKGRHRG